MVEHQRVVITPLPISKAIELSLLYFKNLGFSEIEMVPNKYIKLSRGNVWLADSWINKKMDLELFFSLTQDKKVAISCKYNFSTWVYEGSKDHSAADMEINGFIQFLEKQSIETSERKRICPKCKREIPWDAKLCPYCGYDFSGLEKENMKTCPNCKKAIPVDVQYCPYCGHKYSEK